MANTVDLDNLEEFQANEATLEEQCKAVAQLIRDSKHTIFFTGAGISTTAGIPDFRGPNGVWTRKAQGRAPPASVRMDQAVPTYSHMAMAHLIDNGGAQYCVSQNVDGLHRRSGIPYDSISELHGNTYKEVCWGCDEEYLRTFRVCERSNGPGCVECHKRVPHFCHCTARLCEKCGTRLKDSIIHFKENLPEKALELAFEHGAKADLCIVLGSSLTVSPACKIPKETYKNGGKVVIVNLQRTPYDNIAACRIHGKIDDVMSRVMTLLGQHDQVPAFVDSQAFQDELDRINKSFGTASSPRSDNGKSPKKKKKKTAKSKNSEDEEFDQANSTGILSRIRSTLFGEQASAPSADNNPQRELTAEEDQGGFVVPVLDCAHQSTIQEELSFDRARAALASGCETCDLKLEPWMCVTCHTVQCGRYVNQHMREHSQSTGGHSIAISLSDLTVWCYACNAYILSDNIDNIRQTLEFCKHGEI